MTKIIDRRINWWAWLVLLVIVMGQLYYLPERLAFLHQTLAYTQLADSRQLARLAYQPASYDLLTWVEKNTSPKTTLLLVTASPHTYGDPSYVLYHRAVYHLYPRSVWWAAPVSPTRYPAWWVFTDLTEVDILNLAQKYHAAAILADGFAQPLVSHQSLAFDTDTHLIFVETEDQRPEINGSNIESSLPHLQSSLFGLLLRMFGAILSIWLWGDLVCGSLLRHRLTPSPVRRLAAAWLLGCSLTSLGVFMLLWAGLTLTQAVIALNLLSPLLWLYAHRQTLLLRPCSSAPLPPCIFVPPSHLFFLAIILLQVGLVAFAAWASPLTEWDAWVNWASKANAIYIDQTLAPTMYHNPARLPTNMDYPLMLPLTEAWFYTWLGHIYEPIIGLMSLLFYGALLLLFYDAARRFVSPTAAIGFTALLVTIPRLERPAHSGLADIPLAALVFLSFLLLFEIFTNWSSDNHTPPLPHSPAPLLLLALSTGLLPWLKNEGWLWWGLVSLALLIGLILQVRRNYLPGRQAAFLFLIYFLPALLIPLLWQLFLTMFETYRFTFLPLTLANFWTNLPRLPVIGWHMLARLLNPYWNFVWLLAALTLLGRRSQILAAPIGWLILPVTGYLGLVSLSYVFSRFDPFLAHLNNSAERLILQAAPLVWWWLLGQSVALGWVRKKSSGLKEI